MKKIFLVKYDYINSRLDRWFKKNVCDVPQSLIEKNIRKGNIKINYKNEKEIEIGKLKEELNEFKIIVESSKKSYEETLDKTTQSIEKFIENTENNQKKNIQ